jgi:hypothetical protein
VKKVKCFTLELTRPVILEDEDEIKPPRGTDWSGNIQNPLMKDLKNYLRLLNNAS